MAKKLKAFNPSWLPKRKPFATKKRSTAAMNNDRAKWQKFYNASRWRKVSKAYAVSVQYLCESCLEEEKYTDTAPVGGKPQGATDHIKPLKLGGSPYDFENLQRLCLSCHAKKSGKEAHGQG